MKLTEEQIQAYSEDGFLLLENYFSPSEVDEMLAAFDAIKGEDLPCRVLEEKTGLVRALHGSHEHHETFAGLVRQDRMLEPAKQLLESDVYVYQFKINCKEAFGGGVWQWHQDYIFWQKEDSMPRPDAVNIMIFLDEVTEFNGPLIVIPKSHQVGGVDVESKRSQKGGGDWEENVSAYLKYSLDEDTIKAMAEKGGMLAPKGSRGSVLFFHPNIAHGSGVNISPHHRRLLIVTYNDVKNAPDPEKLWRPDFLVGRDTRPL